MLKSRWLSTFTVIGAVLIVLGIVGLVLGPKFIYDPGQPITGQEGWCYLAVGALMVLNGVMTPAPTPEQVKAAAKSRETASTAKKRD